MQQRDALHGPVAFKWSMVYICICLLLKISVLNAIEYI